jgi:hypothetical protein
VIVEQRKASEKPTDVRELGECLIQKTEDLFLDLGIVTVLVIMNIVKKAPDIGSTSNYKDMVQMENDCLFPSFC